MFIFVLGALKIFPLYWLILNPSIYVIFQPNEVTFFNVRSTEEIDSFNLVVSSTGLTHHRFI